MEIQQVLFFFSLSIIFAFLLHWSIPFFKKQLIYRRHNARKKRLIEDLLEKSIAQRSKFRIEIIAGELQGASSEGPCAMSKNNQLCVELVGTFAAQQWEGAKCIIFFHITQAHKITFFHFHTKCLEAVRRGDITKLYFKIPEQLEPGQKRKSLRCVPPKHGIAGLGLWLLKPETPLPTHKKQLDKPMLAYRPNQENSIGIADISAGGICLLVRYTDKDMLIHKFKPGTRVLGLIMLRADHLENKSLTLWVSCRIVSLTELKGKNVSRLCMRFDTWACMDESKSEIMWFPNDENSCIPVLSNLILRWNMEIHKKD